MNLEEARSFAIHINQATGNWPVLYSGYYIKQLLGSSQDPVLARCPFWLAQYGPTAVVPANWDPSEFLALLGLAAERTVALRLLAASY